MWLSWKYPFSPHSRPYEGSDFTYSIGQLRPDATQIVFLPFANLPGDMDYLVDRTYKPIRIEYEPEKYVFLCLEQEFEKVASG